MNMIKFIECGVKNVICRVKIIQLELQIRVTMRVKTSS